MSGHDERTSKIRTVRLSGSGDIGLSADVGGHSGGQPVILLHGGGQTRHAWGSAMRTLVGNGCYVVNLDTRGHGDSDWSAPGDYSLDALAADLRSVITTLHRPPVLVGASMGGATALCVAGEPETGTDSAAVGGLVLVDIVPSLEIGGARRITDFMKSRPEGFSTLEEAADAVAAFYPERPRPKDVSGLRKNLRMREDGRLHWHWDPAFLDDAQRTEPPQFADRLLAAARRVRCPTLLVRGLKSDIVSERGVAELRQCIPELEVCDVAGAGHMVAGDRNDAFNRGVLEFLERHFSAL